MRHMGSSEKVSSPLQREALALIANHSWTVHEISQTFDVYVAPVNIRTCLTRVIIKYLRLDLAERGDSKAPNIALNDEEALVPGAHMFAKTMSLVVTFAQRAPLQHRAHGVILWEESESSFGRANARTIKVHRAFQAWLQPQLIVLRSWVLFWVELSHKDLNPTEFNAATAALVRGVATLRTSELTNEGMMEPLLEACGFNHIGVRRQEGSVPGSHARWERFANLYLDGVPLPGCSNWACTNLGGFSEAALPTLLCSGCRRVRYCSVKCQRAAWVEGEHRDVCGGLVRVQGGASSA